MANGNGSGNGELTGLQRAFIDEWFKDFNGTRAAERAGYQGDDNVLAYVASTNLRKPKIKAEIERRWAAHGVTAEEVIATLTRQMRASPADFMDEYGRVDLGAIKENGRSIVKSIKIDKGNKIEFSLESSQRAAELIGKTMRLFVDKQEIDVHIDDVDTAIERELAKLAGSRQDENAGAATGD